ncbi:hypothetical protein PVAND_013514 [Polypedilum vanderplanki]|uniref:Glutathione peroxidase n=1 Tax=Polypedilum vanderplanki TaxID=319348 RepID=A0A9J6CRM7_POLVA|nr:hypothetical protein PVAND_013514 [Polypedilum vanderplanki]
MKAKFYQFSMSWKLWSNMNTHQRCCGMSMSLRILAFPSNQFLNQEPGTSEEIQNFTQDRNVKFDLFQKIDVNGKNAHPLYQYLKKEQGGTLFDAIKWNFTKFIIDKNGKPVERHSPNTSPKEMLENLKKYF